MTASVLILMIGMTDVARTASSRLLARLGTAAVWVGLALLAVWGLGVPLLLVGAVVAVAIGWTLCMPATDGPRPRRLWPVLVLVLLVTVATAYDSTAGPATGFLVDAYTSTFDASGRVPIRTALAAVAVATFLTTSGNLIVRAALGRSQRDGAVAAPPTGGWEVRVRGRVVGSIDQPRHEPSTESDLRGGRLIGPVERLLIVVLALAGAQAVIAALLAAKGIVRFPEISEDRRSGSKAEEFLIGSLASWSVAAATVLYLTAVASG